MWFDDRAAVFRNNKNSEGLIQRIFESSMFHDNASDSIIASPKLVYKFNGRHFFQRPAFLFHRFAGLFLVIHVSHLLQVILEKTKVLP